MKFAYLMLAAAVSAAEPNPPNWDSNKVKILSPGQADAQDILNAVWAEQGGHEPPVHGQFSDSRYAIFLEPGSHTVDVNVGFYTQVMGLGYSPSDTVINNLWCENGDFDFSVGALDNFWRSAENFKVMSTYGGALIWAVSQASPMRRMDIPGDLWFFQVNPPSWDAGYASGGFFADSIVGGDINNGSQQQFMTRNTQYNSDQNGVWNIVHVGDYDAPEEHCSNSDATPTTTIEKTPIIREKPYIVKNGDSYKLMRPQVEFNKQGHTPNSFNQAEEIDFSQVYVASENDSAELINSKLDEGLHLVLQPGQYQLDSAIKVNNANTVVLGLGLATLIPTNGNTCMEVADVDGVSIGGILFQAGNVKSDSLLKVGSGSYSGDAANPTTLSDLFARVGGPTDSVTDEVSARTMVEVNSGNVIIDNAWLWRADHDIVGLVSDERNPVDNGIVINGDNVTAYGLAAEHTLGDLVYWKGNHGRTYFYQSELPYDVNTQWASYGYAGYHVDDSVTNHEGYGVGVYSFFRDYNVIAPYGIKAPDVEGVKFVNPLAVFLNGNGGIANILNNDGLAVHDGQGQQWSCSNNAAELFLQ